MIAQPPSTGSFLPPGDPGANPPLPPLQPPRDAVQVSRRQAQLEYVAGDYGPYATSYYRSLPPYIDDLSRSLGADIYERMLLDEQVHSNLRTLVESILSDDVSLRPAVDSRQDPEYEKAKNYVGFMERNLIDLPTSIEEWLREMLGALALGNRVAETICRLEESGKDAGRLVLDRVKVKPRNRVAFVIDAYTNVTGILGWVPGWANIVPGGSILPNPDPTKVPNYLPREKFCVLTYAPQNEDPRGTSLLRSVYERWWEKMQACRDWLAHLGQFGSPSLVGTTAPEAQGEPSTDGQGNVDFSQPQLTPEQAMVNTLMRFRNGYAIAVPYGATVQLLQSALAGDAFIKKVDYCDRQIAAGILLNPRTVKESKYDSRADAEAAQDVTSLEIRRLKLWAGRMISHDLFRPLIRANFGEHAARYLCPRATLSPTEHQDWAEKAPAVATLKSAGILQPSQMAWVYEELGIPAPTEPIPPPTPSLEGGAGMLSSVAPGEGENLLSGGVPAAGATEGSIVAPSPDGEGGRGMGEDDEDDLLADFAGFDPALHPRGQPQNRGEFTSKGTAAPGPASATATNRVATPVWAKGTLSDTHRRVLAGYLKELQVHPKLNANQKREYGEALVRVVGSMSERAALRLGQGLSKILWQPSVKDVTRAFEKVTGVVKEQGKVTNGFYGGQSRRAVLNGATRKRNAEGMGGDQKNTHGTYAHEFGHAIDRGHHFSGTSAWQAAWKAEIEQKEKGVHRLSEYARTDAHEGFAEFSRLLHGSGVDRATIERRFPKCVRFWRQHGLYAPASKQQATRRAARA